MSILILDIEAALRGEAHRLACEMMKHFLPSGEWNGMDQMEADRVKAEYNRVLKRMKAEA